jgi:hypothetical protein
MKPDKSRGKELPVAWRVVRRDDESIATQKSTMTLHYATFSVPSLLNKDENGNKIGKWMFMDPSFFTCPVEVGDRKIGKVVDSALDSIANLTALIKGDEKKAPLLIFLWNIANEATRALNSFRSIMAFHSAVQHLAQSCSEWPEIRRAGMHATMRTEDAPALCPLDIGRAKIASLEKVFSPIVHSKNSPARSYAQAAIETLQFNRGFLPSYNMKPRGSFPKWFKNLSELPDEFNKDTAMAWGKVVRQLIKVEAPDFWRYDEIWKPHVDGIKRKLELRSPGSKIDGCIRNSCLDAIQKAVPSIARCPAIEQKPE